MRKQQRPRVLLQRPNFLHEDLRISVLRTRSQVPDPILQQPASITTSVQGGMWGDARMAARRLAWERLARSLLSCVSSSHRSNSVGPNRSRGSISRTTR